MNDVNGNGGGGGGGGGGGMLRTYGRVATTVVICQLAFQCLLQVGIDIGGAQQNDAGAGASRWPIAASCFNVANLVTAFRSDCCFLLESGDAFHRVPTAFQSLLQ